MIFSDEVLTLAATVIDANRAAGLTVVTAESCTGGLVAGALTEIAGSSDVVDRGFVTYSNEAKIESLGVSIDILDTFGAVSIAVAWAMAQGALKHSHADVAVAVTGIAGPGGGSEKKPVGTVVFALARRNDPDCKIADTKFFGDLGRSEIRRQAVLCALQLLMPG
ncbi:CinA family protein [Glacieibacterium megasporae]|uniref:CinA family protein n=1 Tax=Glacieibacterium megasporae TaxID=2835787 RepID=UPI001C1E12BA|nr:CinA family protein [Polymorphobacter megasporae]UAJ09400.1 CinA family protein [Polymorphobacter megasporae]